MFYSPPTVYGSGDSVELRTISDSQGKFSLRIPQLKRILVNGVNFLAYRPGLAITANPFFRGSRRLILEKPATRTVLVEGPDGKPVAGARIVPRMLSIFGQARVEVPDTLAGSLATSTEPDGKATLHYLAVRDRLMAVRLTTDAIGTQDILLAQRSGDGSEPSVITIRLKSVTHLSGRIVDAGGQAVAGQLVGVWSRGDAAESVPNTVEFKSGPLRTAPDGSFQTPDNLIAGSAYRLAIRDEGKDPIYSDWITMTERPRILSPFVLRPLRTIRGRIVDRQGKPVAGVEVFQSGDGPERTSARTDTEGRFALGGFRPGTVFLSAHGESFRFQGRLIKPAETDVTIELTRASQRPRREMKMLPDPIPFEESQRLARRLAEPLWETAAADGSDNEKYSVLSRLVNVDPARVLERIESVKFTGAHPRIGSGAKSCCRWLGPISKRPAPSPSRSKTPRHGAVTDRSCGSLPVKDRARKLGLLDRALLQARIATDQGDRLRRIGEVADRFYELGEFDKAKRLCSEGLEVAKRLVDKTDDRRGLFAVSVARIDTPAALAIGTEFDKGGIWGAIARQLVDQNPAEAERIWSRTSRMSRGVSMDPTLAWKLATADPAAARRVIEGLPITKSSPYFFLFIALGAKARSEAAALDAFQIGVKGIDRLLQETPERYQGRAGASLPIVERIDPALVPEVFWLDVSSRFSTSNPRMISAGWSSHLITRLAWYDRDVAAALFESVKAAHRTGQRKRIG